MTRNEFWEDINTWGELLELCDEYGCDCCEDVLDESDYDDNVESDIGDRNCGWASLRDYLYDLPSGDDYYRRNGWMDYDALDDDDFSSYKDDVFNWLEDGGYFDDDEEEDEDEDEGFYGEEEEDDDAQPAEEEDFSVGDLIGMCGVAFFAIREQEAADAREQDEQFAKLTSMSAAANRTI